MDITMEPQMDKPQISPAAADLFGAPPPSLDSYTPPVRHYGERGSVAYAAYVQTFIDRVLA